MCIAITERKNVSHGNIEVIEKAELGSVFFVSPNRGAGTVDLWISPIISWRKH